MSALDSATRERLRTLLKDGDMIVWGQANAQPMLLTEALVDMRHAFARLRLFMGLGQSNQFEPGQADVFEFMSYCGTGHRSLAQAGVLDIVACHFSQLPQLMRAGSLRVDVVLVQVSPPDEQGRYSLGLVNEYLPAALDAARVVIGEVNPGVPWTHGERCLGADDFDLLVHSSAPLPQMARSVPGAIESAIAQHAAGLIEDGSTLQTGLGSVPEAILSALHDRRDLGLHSGAIGDAIVALSEAGVITNAKKEIDRGVSIAGSLMGGERLNRFAHRNPGLHMRGTDYTHNAAVLASFKRFVALNSAVEVDLTGQVNAEVAAGQYVGAVGGALDFLRAAQASEHGLPIVALPSTAGKHSRIVARLSGPVSTPRSDTGVFVTEYGVADLRGLSLSQRVPRMLAIAHPAHREALARQFRDGASAGTVGTALQDY